MADVKYPLINYSDAHYNNFNIGYEDEILKNMCQH